MIKLVTQFFFFLSTTAIFVAASAGSIAAIVYKPVISIHFWVGATVLAIQSVWIYLVSSRNAKRKYSGLALEFVIFRTIHLSTILVFSALAVFLAVFSRIEFAVAIVVVVIVPAAFYFQRAFDALRSVISEYMHIRRIRKINTIGFKPGDVYMNTRIAPIHQSSPSESFDILLLSDIHIPAVTSDELEFAPMIAREADPKEMLRFVISTIEERKPSLIIVAGDITDTGEWSSFNFAVDLFASIGVPTIACPGNHDMHYGDVFRGKPTWKRVFNYLWRTTPYDPDELTTRVLSVRRQFGRFDFSEKLVLKGAAGDYPLLYHTDIETSVGPKCIDILVCDSNRHAPTYPGSNAMGQLGDVQLEEAADLLLEHRRQDSILIVVLHHHVVSPRAPSAGVAPFLICLDSDSLFHLAARFNADVIVNGHTHMPDMFIYDGDNSMNIVSCGSAQYPAIGANANTIGGPSAVGLKLCAGNGITAKFITNQHYDAHI
jgi:predicted phosphodiesterase